jgi:hypothetical protein
MLRGLQGFTPHPTKTFFEKKVLDPKKLSSGEK